MALIYYFKVFFIDTLFFILSPYNEIKVPLTLKRTLLSFSFLIYLPVVSTAGFSQSVDTVFVDKSYHTVENRKEAKYFRMQARGKELLHGIVRFYYLDGVLAAESQYVKGSKEGSFTSFYPNGATRAEGNMRNSQEVGKWQWWYANGKPMQVQYYPEEVPRIITGPRTYRMESFWDSTGRQMVTSGTGAYYFCYDNGKLEHKGQFLNGAPHGKWLGYHENGKPYYEEEWKEGELVSGKSYSEEGRTYTYEQIREMPTYQGGHQGLYKYLGHTIRYPDQARKNRIMGEVRISFTIAKDGSVTDARVIQSVGSGCDEEALRVVEGMKGWNPGKNRGQSIAVNYILPLRFTLQP